MSDRLVCAVCGDEVADDGYEIETMDLATGDVTVRAYHDRCQSITVEEYIRARLEEGLQRRAWSERP